MTFVKTYHDSSSAKYEQFNLKEISRYAGGLEDEKFILSCLEEVSNKLVYKVCYRKFSLKTNGSTLDMDFAQVTSADLAKTLQNCDGIILFAATVGIEIDLRLLVVESREVANVVTLFYNSQTLL